MGGSPKKTWDKTVGKATDKLWNEPTKGIRHTTRKALGDHLYNLGSAVGAAIATGGTSLMSTGGLAQAASMKHQYDKIQEDDVVKAAYIAAGAIGALGAGGGLAFGGEAEATAGATSTGAATAGTAASAGAAAEAGTAMSAGTKLALGALGLSAASSVYGTVEQKKAAKAQARAQARAEANAAAAERESEILRKRALLASQKSMTARRAAAGAIVNKLKNTSGYLGEDEEKLGD